ncbi:MAG: Flp family type IVb pilin [Pseudomonadota bacterium]
MTVFRKYTTRFQRNDSGATAVEYGLLAALMAVALIGAIGSTGKSTGDKWDGVAEDVEDAMTNAGT